MPPSIELIIYYLVSWYQTPFLFFIYLFFHLPVWNWRSTPAFTNVLSSGLPLPAPGLPCALFVSGIRGLGFGCPAERRLGPVVVRISLQPLSGIGCFLRFGRCGFLQPAVIFSRPNRRISIIHGKKRRSVLFLIFKR